jgi:hypothetical protein
MFFHDASPHSCLLAVLWWLDRRNHNYLCQILTFPKTLDRLHRGQKKLVTSKSNCYAARVNAVFFCTDTAFHSGDLMCCLVQLAECCAVLMVRVRSPPRWVLYYCNVGCTWSNRLWTALFYWGMGMDQLAKYCRFSILMILLPPENLANNSSTPVPGYRFRTA